MRIEVDRLQATSAESAKQNQAILIEKQTEFENALAANLRMVEDQAALHLAAIKKDMDTSKARMAESSEKIDAMQRRYADPFRHISSHGQLVYDFAQSCTAGVQTGLWFV